MTSAEKSALIASLSSLITRNGPEYPSEHPGKMLQSLKKSCGETPAVALLYYLAVSGIFAEAMSDNSDPQSLTDSIQKNCFLKIMPARDLADLISSVYATGNLTSIKQKQGAAFEKLCDLEDFEYTWHGKAEWRSGGGVAECEGSGTAGIRVSDKKTLKIMLSHYLPNYLFSDLNAIEEAIAARLSADMNNAFADFVNEDDYYQPVSEDFEFEAYLTGICKSYGLELLAASYTGSTSDWEPDSSSW